MRAIPIGARFFAAWAIRRPSGAQPARAKASNNFVKRCQGFRQVFCSFCQVLSSFSKYFFGGFVEFLGVTRQKLAFLT
jgi:hypothetical protein